MSAIAIYVCALIFLLILGGGVCLFLTGKMKSLNVGVLIFGMISILMMGAGCVIACDRYVFAQRAVSAPGEVVSVGETYQREESGQRVIYYAPKVRFTTPQERAVEFIGPISNSRSYTQGDRVEVAYLPEAPERARIKSFDMMWLVVAGLFVIGGAFGGIALRVLFQHENPAQASSLRLVSSRNRRKAAIPPPI